jgi:hypothetical protein
MKKVFLVFMILPLCLMLFINTAYRHHHITPDGNRVSHAHPFGNSGNSSGQGQQQGHQHSDMEILTLSLLSDSTAIVALDLICPEVYLHNASGIGTFKAQDDLFRNAASHTLLRAPPSASLV